jgi:Ca2+-binding EF-hand superfamily protein
MKLKTIVLISGVAVLLATGGESFASETVPPGVMAAFKARFNLIDANKDGKVTRKEYVEFHRKQAAKRFDRVDKQKKGYVTREEVEQFVEETSKRMKETRKKWQEQQKKWQEQQKKRQEQQQQKAK